MTNEEAIEIIEKIEKRLLPSMKEEKEALDIAIRALKRESFYIDDINSAHATIKELLNRIYGMQSKEKMKDALTPVSERLPESRISYLRGDNHA